MKLARVPGAFPPAVEANAAGSDLAANSAGSPSTPGHESKRRRMLPLALLGSALAGLLGLALLVPLSLSACSATPSGPPAVTEPPKPSIQAQPMNNDQPTSPLPYAEVASRITDATLSSRVGWTKLEQLCDDIGPRLSGSKSLELAVDWAHATFDSEGHENVRRERRTPRRAGS